MPHSLPKPVSINPPLPEAPIGLLLSGGLDSAILLVRLLAEGRTVQPFYIRSHLRWEPEELAATRALLAEHAQPGLRALVVLEMPVADLYAEHWSITGRDVPDGSTPDEAVYLPGRNALLILKAALWCVLNEVPQLALATLASNPFADATDEFFAKFERMVAVATGRAIRVWRPFDQLHKTEVMALAHEMSLVNTFSCLDPIAGRACGRCNKCHERQLAFRGAGRADPTHYANRPERVSNDGDTKQKAMD